MHICILLYDIIGELLGWRLYCIVLHVAGTVAGTRYMVLLLCTVFSFSIVVLFYLYHVVHWRRDLWSAVQYCCIVALPIYPEPGTVQYSYSAANCTTQDARLLIIS